MTKKVDPMADLISQAEAARIREVTRTAISDLIKRGKLKGVEVGGRTLVSRSEVKKFKPAPPAGRPRKDKAA
jgi:excisionase family DNA binding protein